MKAADVICASDIPTSHLLGLALTVPVVSTRNELFGRSHAFYSIASDLITAIEFILAEPDEDKRRYYAAHALGRAGYRLADRSTLDPDPDQRSQSSGSPQSLGNGILRMTLKPSRDW